MRLVSKRLAVTMVFFLGLFSVAFGQRCPTAEGDESSYGVDEWIGYVYDGVNTFNAGSYQGFVTEPVTLGQFCTSPPEDCNFIAENGCSVLTETFSVRYKNQLSLPDCGTYTFEVGSDYGVRFSINGGSTFIINVPSNTAYQVHTAEVFLSGGTYDLVLEYFHNTGTNQQVSFDYDVVTENYGGLISDDQTRCESPINPAQFLNVAPALLCSGDAPQYQWQISDIPSPYDWQNVVGATSASYDVPPSVLTPGTYYFRRRATDVVVEPFSEEAFSNILTVIVNEPQGNVDFYPPNSWRGYVYHQANSFDLINYRGYFDNAGLGINITDFGAIPLAGCDFTADNFSVRFRREHIFTCEEYEVSLSANESATLYIDGVPIPHGTRLFLDGEHLLVLEYYDSDGAGSSLSLSITGTGITGNGGLIGSDQTLCQSIIDPAPFTSILPADFCSGTFTYQWQQFIAGVWTDISGAESATYDVPSGLSPGTHQFRRQAIGSSTVESNVITVIADIPEGNPSFFPSGDWRGYVYQSTGAFLPADYKGYFDIGSTTFTNYDFGCPSGNCTLALNGCDAVTENFSVLFRSEQNFACGQYELSVSADNGVRLLLDNAEVINGTGTATVFLNGNHQFTLEYFHTTGLNTVSFGFTSLDAVGYGGLVGSDQDLCQATINPAPFTSTRPAQFCTGTISYQWQTTLTPGDEPSWTNINLATSATYDVPSGTLPIGTHYFRRRATNGTDIRFSNIIEVIADSPPPGSNPSDTPPLDSNEWTGYVFSGSDNYTNNYRGVFTRPLVFNELFGGSATFFAIDGCDVFTENFSVLFKTRKTLPCGTYRFFAGADDGIRLRINGGPWIIDEARAQPYTVFSTDIYLDGTEEYLIEMQYYELSALNQVSFDYTFLGAGYAGTIVGGENFCGNTFDPSEITNGESAIFCSGDPAQYQWQISNDGLGWTNILGATNENFIPDPGATATRYYRRRATDGTTTLYSNVVSVIVTPIQGDETTPGDGYWIGYVYQGETFDEYRGFIDRPFNFDESFCGSACDFQTNGCDVFTDDFSIRFKMQRQMECGTYEFTIGSDDGSFLTIDGPGLGSPFEIDGDRVGPYLEFTGTVYLEGGVYDFELTYFERTNFNRVSFRSVYLGGGDSGTIGSDQEFCEVGSFDPAPLTSIAAPTFCNLDPPTYQWQRSADGNNWTNIAGATSATYDPPAGETSTVYFRRRERDGDVTTLFSNVVTITHDPRPDPSTRFTYGTDEWIGHVYNTVPPILVGLGNTPGSVGEPIYTDENYQGYFIMPFNQVEEPSFASDQPFCVPTADVCTFQITGCNFETNFFSVQFRMTTDLPPGNYIFRLRSDDGSRLYINGVNGGTPVIDYYWNHGYSITGGEFSEEIPLAGGTYEFIIDFYDRSLAQRITFSYTVAPLPVTWYYLNGYHENGQSVIEWKTATELNNSGFDVERSFDGKVFEKIGWVDGNGTSNEMHQYTFIDDLPQHGWNYYRLKQVDYDGKFEYSRLVPVFVDDLPDLQLYPNPMNDHLYLSRLEGDQTPHVTITNVLAQRTWSLQQDPIQPARFQLPQRLEPGVYSVRVTMGTKTTVRKIIVQ